MRLGSNAHRGGRLPGAVLATIAVCLALTAGSAGAATWTVTGGGFGHGVGMGAYGAYGMADAGRSYGQILRHYYTGVKITKLKKARYVRVLLDVSAGPVRFSGVTAACKTRLDPGAAYEARRRGSSIRLYRPNGRLVARCGGKLGSKSEGAVSIDGLGDYRGTVELVPTESASGSLNVVNYVGVNDYAKGVLPKEMVPSWPIESLKAFAVAARSIALTTDVQGNGFSLYPDTRTQVYGGLDAETRETNRACAQSSSQVVTYGGEIAQAFYTASTGGRTENVENVFFGGPVPYLKGVPDPYDSVSPYHRWKETFSQSRIDSLLGSYVDGRLKRIQVTQRGFSPRVMWARLYGTAGMTKIRGDTLQYALGLLDRWMNFRKSG